MKIIIFSDTHKNYRDLHRIVANNIGADMFLHLGDGFFEYRDVSRDFPEKEFHYVRGNCDYGDIDAPRELVLPITDGVKAFLTHGDLYNVNTDIDTIAARARNEDCQIALYGHTHIYRTEFCEEYGVYVMNPGSVERPRGKNPPSYGVIEIDEERKIVMNIVSF